MITRHGDRYRIDGPVTLDTVIALLAQSEGMHSADAVVDFAAVTSVDSSALSLMLEWMRRSRSAGRQIAFASVGTNLRSLAELYGTVDLLPFAA